MISWPNILIGALIAIPVGVLTTAIYGVISRKLSRRNQNSTVRRYVREQDERLFAYYLLENPHMIAVVRSNYRAKLARHVFDVVWIALTLLFFVWLISVTPEIYWLTAYAAVASALFIGGFYNFRFYRAYTMQQSMRRVTRILDETCPVSTDMSDEVWRRFTSTRRP